MWHSRPLEAPPFMAKNILNFHFDYLNPSLMICRSNARLYEIHVESRIMRMKIYLNCVRMHCVVFKYVVIQLNHRYSFHYNEGLQAGSTFRPGKFSSSMVHSNASTAASFLAKLTSTSWRPLPRLKRGCSPSLQNWRKWFLVAVYLMHLLSVNVSVKRPDEGSATIKT